MKMSSHALRILPWDLENIFSDFLGTRKMQFMNTAQVKNVNSPYQLKHQVATDVMAHIILDHIAIFASWNSFSLQLFITQQWSKPRFKLWFPGTGWVGLRERILPKIWKPSRLMKDNTVLQSPNFVGLCRSSPAVWTVSRHRPVKLYHWNHILPISSFATESAFNAYIYLNTW